MLELYHWAPNGPWLKPLIVLAEKEIPCTLHAIDVLAFEQYGPRMPNPSLETRLNLEGEGPLLVHDGRQLTESFFMIEYLNSAFDGPPLAPTDPVLFNRMLTWSRFTNEVFMPAANILGCRQFLAPELADKALPDGVLDKIELGFVREGWKRAYRGDYPNALLEDCRRRLATAVGRIEEALKKGPWLLGQVYTLADIDVFSIARSLALLTPDLASDRPHLHDWLKRVEERTAVRKALSTGGWRRPETAFAPGPEPARWG